MIKMINKIYIIIKNKIIKYINNINKSIKILPRQKTKIFTTRNTNKVSKMMNKLILQEKNHSQRLNNNLIPNIKINPFQKIIDTQFKMTKVFIINKFNKIIK